MQVHPMLKALGALAPLGVSLVGASPAVVISVIVVLAVATIAITWITWDGKKAIAKLRYTPTSNKVIAAPKAKRRPKGP
jgi:hypothetical protein